MTMQNQCVLSFGFCRPNDLAKSVLSINKNYSEKKEYKHILIIDRASKDSVRYESNQKTIEFSQRLLEQEFVDEIIIRDEPFGTQQNIIVGVSDAAREYEEIFVVEDDLELINFHRDLTRLFFERLLNGPVVAFSTYSNLMRNAKFSTFLSHRFSSQAWGTTSKIWNDFDLEYIRKLVVTKGLKKELVKYLGSDMPRVVDGFQSGAIDSWAIPWNVFNYLNGNLMVYPSKSYIVSGGHRSGATRTGGVKFKSELATDFLNVDTVQPPSDFHVSKNYVRHFSVMNRGIRKLESKFLTMIS